MSILVSQHYGVNPALGGPARLSLAPEPPAPPVSFVFLVNLSPANCQP